MTWCDIGVNFTDKRLHFKPVFDRALAADVRQMIITGTSLTQSHQAEKLASSYPSQLFATVGIHPHSASTFSDNTIVELKSLARSKQVVAIGECGLDFNRNFSTPQQQLYAFEQQLNVACELGLPVFLHERDAFDAQMQLLKTYHADLVGGVAHCFTGNIEQMRAYLDLDMYIGVTGWLCDPKRGESLRDAVQTLPLERVLLETDAPYLRPKGLANNRQVDSGNCEPAHLPFIAKHLSELMGIELDALQKAALDNAKLLFNLPAEGHDLGE